MLPPLKTVEAGLHRATEALAMELAHPGQATPDWDSLHWRLASAAAAAHGVSPLLSGRCRWQYPPWQRFLHEQRSEEHTSELQSLMRISYAVFCLKKKKTYTKLTRQY